MIRKWIKEGGKIPWGYGVCWRVFADRQDSDVLCLPIGLHFLARLSRHYYWKLVKMGTFRSSSEGEMLRFKGAGYFEMKRIFKDMLLKSEIDESQKAKILREFNSRFEM